MPAMKFAHCGRYKHKKGKFYLGVSPFCRVPVGIKTERHAVTVAGAGSGKGACVITPNLLRWPHNALVIDPKGEAAELTATARQKLGQSVHVLDPFNVANIPPSLRASVNLLEALDTASISIAEQIRIITDGIVMRSGDEGAVVWDDGAAAIISGVIAYVLLTCDDEEKNLLTVREIITDAKRLKKVMKKCETLKGCASLPASAASRYSAKEGNFFISGAQANTEWLDSLSMRETLNHSTFKLSDLKNGKCSVYLVLPANYLGQHGRFLRLFVRVALEEMARPTIEKNELRGEQCLFILDEFYSLGRIDEISKAAGLMRGYGLQLWPILQDIGQLLTLYGREGAETFFGNADIHQYFGNTDTLTLSVVSNSTGQHHEAGWFGHNEEFIGRPKMSPQEVRKHVAKRERDIVARRMIVFVQGDDVLSVRPRPYFKKFGLFDAFFRLLGFWPLLLLGGGALYYFLRV